MTLFDHLNAPTYSQSAYAANCMGITERVLFNRLAKGPVTRDAYFLERVGESSLPAFVTPPVDQEERAALLRMTGLAGMYCRVGTTSAADPYESLGFVRTGATSKGNYSYTRKGVDYLSLPYTFHCLGLVVNPSFLPAVSRYEIAPGFDLIYPISRVLAGQNPAFDILYDVRGREYLINTAKSYTQK